MITGTNRILNFDKIMTVNAIIIFMLVYFIFHSIYGQRGVISYFKLQSELQSSHKKLESLRAERLELGNKVKLLQPGSLDLDMLDEQIRNTLGVSASKEQIFKANLK